tara:strand:+ start:519 stop:788 length:270 start_codon:yes stop_codon:yes gene_type:complete
MTKEQQAAHYKDMIAKTFQQWRPRIAAAPNKNGWDRVFKQPIPSRRELLMARDAVLQDILLEAKVLGVKVDVYDQEDTYVSPFDKEEAE